MFDEKSRYSQQPTYTVTDARGRKVRVVEPPEAPQQELLGFHRRRDGQRLDHLAYRYLDYASGFWRICEINDAMNADMLQEAMEIAIPEKE
mgnify:CR=1 FL=1